MNLICKSDSDLIVYLTGSILYYYFVNCTTLYYFYSMNTHTRIVIGSPMTHLMMPGTAAGIPQKISSLIPVQQTKWLRGASRLIPIKSGNIVMAYHSVTVNETYVSNHRHINYLSCDLHKIKATFSALKTQF